MLRLEKEKQKCPKPPPPQAAGFNGSLDSLSCIIRSCLTSGELFLCFLAHIFIFSEMMFSIPNERARKFFQQTKEKGTKKQSPWFDAIQRKHISYIIEVA